MGQSNMMSSGNGNGDGDGINTNSNSTSAGWSVLDIAFPNSQQANGVSGINLLVT